MGKLFTSPLTVAGELHDVHLFNFTVPVSEIAHRVPHPLRPVVTDGRAWISMVRVHLHKMRPAWLTPPVGLHYQHIAYRLLVDCPVQTPTATDWQRGIYFLNSFTDSPLFRTAGNLMSEYAFQDAAIREEKSPSHLRLVLDSRDGKHHLEALCRYDAPPPESTAVSGMSIEELQALVGPLTQAFSVHRGQVTRVAIMREQWPLEAVACDFTVTHFQDARFEAALRVPEVIPYRWNKAEPVPIPESEVSHAAG